MKRLILQIKFVYLIPWLLLENPRVCHGAKSPAAALSAATKAAVASPKSNNFKTKSRITTSKNATTVVQLTETEVWDGSEWKASNDRWTLKNKPTVGPDKQEPPVDTRFEGDWKIVTSKARDSLGWEYKATKPYPTRKRIWLRSVIQVEEKAVKKRKNKRHNKRPKWMQALRDEFNFKGFGFSLFKSLIFPEGFGLLLRLPLTLNLNAWERIPALPSVSTSVGYLHPGCAVVFLSTSMRIEWIKWATARTFFLLQYMAVWLLWSLSRGLVLASSAVAYPITRKFYSPPMPMQWISARDDPCVYSRTVEERIGSSLAWRLTRENGYEFRANCWHYYAPTMVSTLMGAGLGDKIPPWLAHHSGAWGLTTSAPIPENPFITCSALLSFSGFYFKRKSRVLVQEEGASESIGLTAPSLSAVTTKKEKTRKTPETKSDGEEEGSSKKKKEDKKSETSEGESSRKKKTLASS